MNKEEMTAKMMDFLDARTAAEKIRIFEDMREADEHVLANIAVSLDMAYDDKADNYERIMRITEQYTTNYRVVGPG